MPSPESPRTEQARAFSQSIADQVLAAIAVRGWSVRQAAEKSGINRATLQGRINNKRPFTTDELAMIAHGLGITPGELLSAPTL